MVAAHVFAEGLNYLAITHGKELATLFEDRVDCPAEHEYLQTTADGKAGVLGVLSGLVSRMCSDQAKAKLYAHYEVPDTVAFFVTESSQVPKTLGTFIVDHLNELCAWNPDVMKQILGKVVISDLAVERDHIVSLLSILNYVIHNYYPQATRIWWDDASTKFVVDYPTLKAADVVPSGATVP
jgi:hypothetical protein